MVLAEDVQTVLLEVSVESGTDLSDLAFYDAPQRVGETPVLIFQTTDIASVLKTVSVSGLYDLVDLFAVV